MLMYYKQIKVPRFKIDQIDRVSIRRALKNGDVEP